MTMGEIKDILRKRIDYLENNLILIERDKFLQQYTEPDHRKDGYISARSLSIKSELKFIREDLLMSDEETLVVTLDTYLEEFRERLGRSYTILRDNGCYNLRHFLENYNRFLEYRKYRGDTTNYSIKNYILGLPYAGRKTVTQIMAVLEKIEEYQINECGREG